MRFLSPLPLLWNPNPNFLLRNSNFSKFPLTLKRTTMMAAAAAEESEARGLWARSMKEAVIAKYTPIMIAMAAGNLEVEAFRRYVAQDVCLRRAFAKAYEMAAEFADDDNDKAAVFELRKDAVSRLKLYCSLAKDWGVDSEEEVASDPMTVKYTSFLLATAQGKFESGRSAGKIVTPFEKTKIAAYAVGAMTPYMQLYSHLSKEMATLILINGDHFYKKWIDYYSSKEFEAAVVQTEDVLDKLSVSLTGKELDFIEELYRQAMKHETELFAAQPINQPVVVPLTKLQDPTKRLVLFSDFDLTCTLVDSCAILAEIAILTASRTDQGLADVQKIGSNTASSWEALSRQYAEEYEKIMENLLPKEQVKEFDYNVLHKSLADLSSFEKRANLRVVDSGVLKGLKLDDIKRAGECLKFHDGCSDFFQQILKKKETIGMEFHILSFCWCGDLIRSAFSTVGCLNDLIIHSNEFIFENSLSTGEVVMKMQSPVDKVEAFTNILNEHNKDKQLSVYIGDSVGDLLCLLKANVGIVVGTSESLRRVGKQFGVSFVPLYSGVIMKQRQLIGLDSTVWNGSSGVLYTASSWTEIRAFLLGA